MYTRHMLAMVTMLCAAAVAPLAAQQAQDSTPVAQVNAVRDSSTTSTQGPRLTPAFQTVVPRLDRTNALSSPALPQEGGSNTIVISTLGLVLIAIIIVLLIR